MAISMLMFVVAALISRASSHPDAVRHIENDVGIVGGHNILIEKVPFMASLRLNGTHHWCGASIIHEQFVLTAAHCIKPDREYKVLVGTDNIFGNGQLFDVEEIILHKKYNPNTFDYDVCLIKLKTPLSFGPKVGTIALAESGTKIINGQIMEVNGWGATGVGVYSPKLLQVEVPKIGKKSCKETYENYNFNVTPRMMCAGSAGHDACQGDSGGPLTLGGVQVGITSAGHGCGEAPGVYTIVAHQVSWIDRMIAKHLH